VVGGEEEDQVVLDLVGVLVLVDQDVLEPPLVVLEHGRVLAQQAQGVAEQVVEVHRAGPAQAVLVFAEHVGDLALEQVAGPLGELLDVDAVVLGRADRGVDRAGREALGVEPQVTDDVAGEADGVGLVVDRELAGEAQLVGVAAQDADAGAVERRHPHLLGHRADQGRHPRLHLVGGLVGEGDGEDLERADALVPDEVGDAVGQDSGLARPRAGHDQQWPLRVGDRVGLHRVEPVEEGGWGLGCHRPHHRRGDPEVRC
jgi:hypothetical protein